MPDALSSNPDSLPQIGDIVYYSGSGASYPWTERREKKIPYIVIDTGYDETHQSVLCFLKGSGEPGRWNLNEWFSADPENVTVLSRARYDLR